MLEPYRQGAGDAGGAVLGQTIALQPLQLLWLNLLTDGLLSLGLGTEPAEKDVMQRPPRDPEKGVLVKQDAFSLGLTGVVIAAVSLVLAVCERDFRFGGPAWPELLISLAAGSGVFVAIKLNQRWGSSRSKNFE